MPKAKFYKKVSVGTISQKRPSFSYREPVVDPAAELEHARLVVEREEGHVDGTRRTKFRRRRPSIEKSLFVSL